MVVDFPALVVPITKILYLFLIFSHKISPYLIIEKNSLILKVESEFLLKFVRSKFLSNLISS